MKKRYRMLLLVCSLYLGLHNGYIALWSTQQEKPLQVFPYKAALYPKIDRYALEEGLPIGNEAELEKFLEDLLS